MPELKGITENLNMPRPDGTIIVSRMANGAADFTHEGGRIIAISRELWLDADPAWFWIDEVTNVLWIGHYALEVMGYDPTPSKDYIIAVLAHPLPTASEDEPGDEGYDDVYNGWYIEPDAPAS